MTKLKWLYASLCASFVALLAIVSASVGAWLAKRKATGEISARDDEIRRQQEALNKSANDAALKALKDKATKANEAANAVTVSNVVDIINNNTRD
jgi:hypothetical protein